MNWYHCRELERMELLNLLIRDQRAQRTLGVTQDLSQISQLAHPAQVHDRPVSLALLDIGQFELDRFMASQSTGQEKRKQSAVSLSP